MNINTVLFASALLICEVHCQFCGPPILPPPLHTSVITNSPQLIPAPTPVVGTTIIDTSLSNALANVLQLLIVSDLIESTLNTALGHHSVPLTNPICEPVVPQPIVYTPTIDVTPVEYISTPCSPVIDLFPPRRPADFVPQYGPVIDYLPPCAPVIDFTPPCPPVFDFTPKYGPVIDYLPPCGPFIDYTPPCLPTFDFTPQYGPVIDYSPPCTPTIEFSPPCLPKFDFVPQYGSMIDYIPPCGPIFDFSPPCGPFIEPLPFYGEYTPIPNITPFPTSTPNYCGGLTEYITNVGPTYTQLPSNLCGCQDIIKPVQMAPLVPNCYNGLTEVLSPRVNVGPLATEMIFPSPVPPQLACNIGNIPATLPCVSLNLEPLPCGCGYGNNMIGTPYFY